MASNKETGRLRRLGVRVQDGLKIAFVLKPLNTFDDFATFENQHRRHGRDSVLHGKLHVIAHVNFADNRFSIVVCRQLVNDWTQSFARRSAGGPEIDKHRLVRFENLGFKRIFTKLYRHDVSQLKLFTRSRNFGLMVRLRFYPASIDRQRPLPDSN